MNWKTIRLELAQTDEHPSGSAGRAYLIRLPLDAAGAVDQCALDERPAQATVRRFWPSEPDQCGRVERGETGWVLRCDGGRSPDRVALLESDVLEPGRKVTITQPDGTRLPFRVASIRHLA